MIIEEIKKINSGKKELQKFGLTIGIFLGLLGGVFWWRSGDYYPYFFSISVILLLCALLFPKLLKPLHKVWMSLAIAMGWLMTRIILSVLFYLVITPISGLMKLLGKDIMKLKFDSNKDSYWVDRIEDEKELNDYEKQF